MRTSVTVPTTARHSSKPLTPRQRPQRIASPLLATWISLLSLANATVSMNSEAVAAWPKVYRVFDLHLEGVVAIQLIKPDLRNDPELDARFQGEAWHCDLRDSASGRQGISLHLCVPRTGF